MGELKKILEEVALANKCYHPDGKVNFAQLATAVGTSIPTARKIWLGKGRPPQKKTRVLIESRHAAIMREAAGYEQQTPHRKRERMIGAMQAMSDKAIEDLFEVVMRTMQADLAAEFGEPTTTVATVHGGRLQVHHDREEQADSAGRQ